MAFGLGVLKLPATEFWALTPREFGAALEGHYGRRRASNAGPSRTALEDLMTEYPDRVVKE